MNTFILKIPIAVSVGLTLLAIGLSAGSLGRHVKWNIYNSITYYCDKSFGYSSKLYSYQTLWISYDASFTDKSSYGQVLLSTYNDTWREEARNIIYANLGLDIVCLIVLTACIVCFTDHKTLGMLIAGHVLSTGCALVSAALLAYALHYYKQHYRLKHSGIYTDPSACYPDEDNVSTGFYMVSVASALNFCTVAVNVMNIVRHKTLKTVNPV